MEVALAGPTGGRYHGPRTTVVRRDGRFNASRSAGPMLEPEPSAELRDRLITDLNELTGGDAAALWAAPMPARKEQAHGTDAQRVEEAFQARLASFGHPSSAETGAGEEGSGECQGSGREPRELIRPLWRCRSRVAFGTATTSAMWPSSLAWFAVGAHAMRHHLRFAQSRALGRKVSDEFVVPLCRGHHREVHRHGDEGAWWRSVGIDPTAVARALWLETHPMAINPQRLRTVAAAAPETGSLERTNAGAQRGSNRAKRNMKPIQDTASRNGGT